jgi:hypothetical protein
MAELSKNMQLILNALPEDGSRIGNTTLIKQLLMEPNEFNEAKDKLLQENLIITGRGRGGAIGRKVSNNNSDNVSKETGSYGKTTLSKAAEKILESLPADGSMIGNTYLMRLLGMTAEEFFKEKEVLQDLEKVVTGKGRGGSLGLAKIRTSITEKKVSGGVKEESSLYEPIKKYFDENWGPNYISDCYCSIISGSPKGHKRRSGQWSRPDVSLLTISSYQFLPARILEVTTIEAKRYQDATPEAVFETASHNKFGHQAYLAVEWLEECDIDDSKNENFKRIIKEAENFGIGVIQMKKDSKDGYNFKFILDPKRKDPLPDDCNAFIEQIFKAYHQKILTALGKR